MTSGPTAVEQLLIKVHPHMRTLGNDEKKFAFKCPEHTNPRQQKVDWVGRRMIWKKMRNDIGASFWMMKIF